MKKIRSSILTFIGLILYLQNFGQIDGDNIFASDQIISIELNFQQESFWDSLVINYATETYMKADLTIKDSTGQYSFNDVGVRLKGNSSYSHPGVKKSFKIDFNKYISGQNYDGLKKLNFSNGFKDPTLLREKIFFDICRDAKVPAPRANFANVYFNGELWGFYTVIEQIDDQFLDWRILDDDGNLFKAGDNFGGGPGGAGSSEADLLYYGTDMSSYEDRYELKSNKNENDWTDLIEFTDFINNSSSSQFENDLHTVIELEEYIRSAALDNLFSNLDSYTGSARNYYIYHNLSTQKWEWIKWDGNESFGSYRAGPGINDMTQLALNYVSNNRPLLENIFKSEILYKQYELALCYLVDNFFNATYMGSKIDKLSNLVQSAVYNDSNKMYTNSNFDTNLSNNISLGGGPMGGTIYGLKSFVNQRVEFLKNQLDCTLISSIDEFKSNEISLYPNPSNSFITVEFNDKKLDQITICDITGTVIFSQEIADKKFITVDLSSFIKGSYFTTLYKDRQVIYSKLLIVH